MKVISGFLKGRIIKGYDIKGTRPTMDRVKESIFGSIQFDIENSIVLDLFCGSGNLGIEAISNGAKLVYFNDYSKNALNVISENIKNMRIENSSIILNYDYRKCLEYLKNEEIKLDIIFLDPPYNMKVLNEVVEYILANELLSKNGLIICEVSESYIKKFERLEIKKQKKFGDKEVIILKNK